MIREKLLVIANILILFSCASTKTPPEDQRTAIKKIVLIPGKDSHGPGEHEHLGGCQLLARLINENVSNVQAIVTEQGWPKDTTILDSADAILIYADGGDRHVVIPHMKHMERLMNKGVGLLYLHYAVEVP